MCNPRQGFGQDGPTGLWGGLEPVAWWDSCIPAGLCIALGVVLGVGCQPGDDDDGDTTSTPSSMATPTMTTCWDWLDSSAGLDVPDEACEGDWDFFREELANRHGGTFPVGDGRYYLVYFPESWTPDIGKLVVAIHGTGGCAEWMVNWWYQATNGIKDYAVVALQYYGGSGDDYDPDDVIYANIQAAMEQVRAHCPLETTHVFYHGFSRGSAQAFPIAVRDRGGDKLFSAFIADSGTSSLDYDTLASASDNALTGSRFWMWCGQHNCSSVTPYSSTMCERMEEDMVPYVEGHGGTVDALVKDPSGCHGIFNKCTIGDEFACPDTDCGGDHDPNCNCYDCSNRKADDLGDSLEALFAYIDGF